MKILIIIGGVHSLLFGLFHCMFWDKLHWKSELKKVDPNNEAVMQILNLRIIYVFFLHAILCFFFIEELLTTSLGNFMLIGSALFWLGRTIEQFVYQKQLPFKDPVNMAVTVMFFIGIAIYTIPLIPFI
ncbi:hypothetical protein SAMN05421820_1172 [Pedobacter steynii]|uniref:Uncharacterized protein n=1 Tax=Pedobacter steynii TaxID=430522 RepID=A0A1H0KZ10_9SPHI|nr:hypothetical protein [Pedobacter steynii]NQX43368.1 hypothetical protein [Pedobacter steynii]SDO61013.1 hypothetical protein SAMN05421820_1172 [Pedobacter steynii]